MVRGGGIEHGRRPGRRAAAVASAFAAAALTGGIVSAAVAAAAPPPHNGKVTLCHARPPASAKNGWVEITVSSNAVTHEGHSRHADDIIPSFTYYVKTVQHTFPGLNLATVFSGSTGAQILANGCRLPAPATSSAEPTASPAPTTTTPAPTSASVTAPAPTTPVAVTSVPAPSTETSVSASAAASSAVAARAVDSGRGAHLAAATHVGLAVGDTGDHGPGGGPSTGLFAAVVGGATAGLAGLAALAYRRRRRDLGAQA